MNKYNKDEFNIYCVHQVTQHSGLGSEPKASALACAAL